METLLSPGGSARGAVISVRALSRRSDSLRGQRGQMRASRLRGALRAAHFSIGSTVTNRESNLRFLRTITQLNFGQRQI